MNALVVQLRVEFRALVRTSKVSTSKGTYVLLRTALRFVNESYLYDTPVMDLNCYNKNDTDRNNKQNCSSKGKSNVAEYLNVVRFREN